jgi:hypothetical protein
LTSFAVSVLIASFRWLNSGQPPRFKGGYAMKKLVIAFGFPLIITLVPVRQAAHAQGNTPKDFVPPIVFQAAGPKDADPTVPPPSSIQSAVDAFRAELGEPNHGNTSGPFTFGRREINWDGAPGTDATTAPVTPFVTFLNTRGAQFTTPGTGLSQAPPSVPPGGAQGGLADLFKNPTYGTIFSTFSPLRLFTPVGSNITEALFFVPGLDPLVPATVSGFGAVFTDVDQPDGSGPGKKRGNRGASTLIEYFGADGKLLFSSFVPASPGDGSLSFFGVVFKAGGTLAPVIARVRITTGDVAPGPDDGKQDIVVMDDFIYGEPQ